MRIALTCVNRGTCFVDRPVADRCFVLPGLIRILEIFTAGSQAEFAQLSSELYSQSAAALPLSWLLSISVILSRMPLWSLEVTASSGSDIRSLFRRSKILLKAFSSSESKGVRMRPM